MSLSAMSEGVRPGLSTACKKGRSVTSRLLTFSGMERPIADEIRTYRTKAPLEVQEVLRSEKAATMTPHLVEGCAGKAQSVGKVWSWLTSTALRLS